MPEDDATVEQLRQRLQWAEESLRRSERVAMAGRLAGAIIHEVNNPLEALSNLIYLTRTEAEHPERVHKNMQLAQAQLDRLGEITRKTLSFYRERGETKPIDLVELMQFALRIHGRRLTSIELRKQLPDQLLVKGSAGEILQVLSNFILNAMDALPEEGGVLCLRMRTDQHRAYITIADNGCGIPAGLRTTLFEPYTTSKHSGTGVGLWLSKRIIDKHEGTLRYRSSLKSGKSGTTFRISLPIGLEKDLTP